MKKFGLIGKSLSHSYSAQYFNEKFAELKLDAQYRLFELASPQEIEDFLQQTDVLGLNVTVPYKQTIIDYCKTIDASALRVGAVNCLLKKNNEWIGYNTDVFGFLQSVKPFLTLHHSRALILGTGGAAKAVACALSGLGISFRMVSRNPSHGQLHYQQLSPQILQSFSLIINATPCGMYPESAFSPLTDYTGISDNHLLIDLIYNPEKTLFLQEGEAHGASVLNGMSMLKLQAEKSWEIWNTEYKFS
jgi:shikimate dehydrogenase